MEHRLGETVSLTGYRVQPISRYLRSQKAAYLGFALLAAAGLAMIYALDPRNSGTYPVCPFLGLTGCYCPGCGTLRCLHQLLHGNVVGAFGYNPLAVLSLPFIVYSYATGAARAFRIPAPRPVFVHHRLIWALFVGIIAFWILRNIPVGLLTVLAP